MKILKSLSFVDIFLSLWIAYLLQYFVFGSTGTMYSRVLVLFLLLVSLYYTVYSFLRLQLPLYFKGVALLLVMFTVYGVFLMLNPETIHYGGKVVSSHYYLQHIYISLLPLFPFYCFTIKGKLTQSKISFWILLLFIVAILEFYQGRQQYLEVYGDDEFTNNMGYEIVALFPLLFIGKKNKLFQFIGIGLILLFLFLSVKRGAIIIGVVCALISALYLLKDSRGVQKIAVLAIFIIGIVLVSILVNRLIETNAYFATRLDSTLSGDTSQRGYIYSKMTNYFLGQTNILNILFGSGANATIRILGGFAHNDWLEIGINQGLFGIVVYLVYWLFFLRTWQSIRFDSDIRISVFLSFVIYFLMTFFSMSYDCMALSSTFCLGICMGELSLHQGKNGINRLE